jgi:hypothetical protein
MQTPRGCQKGCCYTDLMYELLHLTLFLAYVVLIFD